jgi:hypothetical protein
MAGWEGGPTLLHEIAVSAAIGSHKMVREDMREALPYTAALTFSLPWRNAPSQAVRALPLS